VNWWESYAFCIWDGGFLPTEAEWEYAAAGGGEQRMYPWGSADPGASNRYAIYACYFPSGTASCSGIANIAPVGTAKLGVGRWGQLDLAGDVWQWNLDSYGDPYTEPCVDCAHLDAASRAALRGGDYFFGVETLSPSYRDYSDRSVRLRSLGIRCARAP
jgi:formylglycine-generating enzyme required for sulfatase activity